MTFSPELLSDLARSGLDDDDALRLGLEDISVAEVRKLGFGPRPAYKIPYWKIDGTKDEFFRLRFLDSGAFKYAQLPGTKPKLYLPPTTNWLNLAPLNVPIIFTEGEKKAAAASRLGIPVIGLGGVWSFKSANRALLDDFAAFQWKGRDVVIIFDSDVMIKQAVRGALHAFAREMSSLGAKAFMVTLPEGPNGEKTGIDDFLVRVGEEEFYKFQVQNREAFDELEEFTKLNQLYAIVVDPPSVYSFANSQLLRPEPFTKLVEADRRVLIVSDSGKPEKANAAEKWIQYKGRRKYASLCYEPGQPSETLDGRLNIWKGWNVESVEGDVSLWSFLLDHVFYAAPESRRYFEQWVAWPIQHPGAKLFVAAMLWGVQQAGKSLIGEALLSLYGPDNSAMVTQRELHGSFNEWSRHKQFILAEEVASTDRRADADMLKTLITRQVITINAKFQPEYKVRDTINYLFTSNHADAAFLDDDDRRFFVHRAVRKLDPARGQEIGNWFRSREGASALRWHLEQVDLTGFNPASEAIATQAKFDMIESGRSDLDRWAHEVISNPHLVLGAGVSDYKARDIWSLKELASAAEGYLGKAPSLKALGNSLARARVSRTTRLGPEHGNVSLWIVSNEERWLSAPADEIATYYAKAARLPKF